MSKGKVKGVYMGENKRKKGGRYQSGTPGVQEAGVCCTQA